jgi:hypothetical protein
MILKTIFLSPGDLHSLQGDYECAICGKNVRTEKDHFASLAQISMYTGLLESRVLCVNCGQEISNFIVALVKEKGANLGRAAGLGAVR